MAKNSREFTDDERRDIRATQEKQFIGKNASQYLLRRVFRQYNGDWAKCEAATKDIIKLGNEIESLASQLIEKDRELRLKTLAAYELAPKKDALYYDSPLSPSHQTLNLRVFFRKLGWDGIRDIHLDHDKLTSFASQVKDGCKWLLKFKE